MSGGAQVGGTAVIPPGASVFGHLRIDCSMDEQALLDLSQTSTSPNPQKYEFTGQTWVCEGGDVGGWIALSATLADNAWVFDESKVSEFAHISGIAEISNHAYVGGNACVLEHAVVSSVLTEVVDNAVVAGDTKVLAGAKVRGNTQLGGWGS